ncbi:MAG: helix-turn-helix domain-containing protein [Nitrosospira sp.]
MTYLTFKDIAKELQISVRTVSRMVADGLPVVHVHGRIYRVHRNALDQFLKRKTQTASSPNLNWRRGLASRYNEAEAELLTMLERAREKKKTKES